MRTIKYRLKINGKWEYGMPVYPVTPNDKICSFQVTGDGDWIYHNDVKTLGQYTGKKDANDQEIWEGDIARFCISAGRGIDVYENRVVVWDDENAQFLFADETNTIDQYYGMDDAELSEIIGNIHDNPELLEANDGNK